MWSEEMATMREKKEEIESENEKKKKNEQHEKGIEWVGKLFVERENCDVCWGICYCCIEMRIFFWLHIFTVKDNLNTKVVCLHINLRLSFIEFGFNLRILGSLLMTNYWLNVSKGVVCKLYS